MNQFYDEWEGMLQKLGDGAITSKSEVRRRQGRYCQRQRIKGMWQQARKGLRWGVQDDMDLMERLDNERKARKKMGNTEDL